jgi:hypothetical protein
MAQVNVVVSAAADSRIRVSTALSFYRIHVGLSRGIEYWAGTGTAALVRIGDCAEEPGPRPGVERPRGRDRRAPTAMLWAKN